MKKWWVAGLALLGIVIAAVCLLQRPEPGSHWSTESSAARQHFEAGFDAWSKAYWVDAVVQFEAALELDPEFAMPMLFLSSSYSPGREERRLWLDRLEAIPLDGLSQREQFLVRHHLARSGRGSEMATKVLAEFLAERPSDPFAIRTQCDEYWSEQHWEEAEKCYESFLKRYPNWASAQNHLGYIAMAQGRFSEAEERFLTYRYIAPDQANPYMSMGELLMLLGRYDEAEVALAEAIRIKPDLCSAHALRSELHAYSGNFALAEALLEDMKAIPTCAFYEDAGFFCVLEAWRKYFEGDLAGARQAMSSECLQRRKGFDLLAHRLAVLGGDDDAAQAMEAALKEHFAAVLEADLPVYIQFYRALETHMRGVRALGDEDFAAAAHFFEETDLLLDYWGGDRSGFKPINRLNWLRALERDGQRTKAKVVRNKIDAVNPQLVRLTRLPDLEDGGQGNVH